ncbi:MAG: peptidylprolyl isomerase, partial [Planctomycetota bacterium]
TPKLPSSNGPKAEPEIKDAVPAGKGTALPPTKQLTMTHQLFIWTMIVIVGVLFGVGSSCQMMTQPVREVMNVNEGEIIPRMQVAERLEKILNSNGHPLYPKFSISRQYQNPEAQYALRLKHARYSQSLGLMPQGAALDRIERDFLATPMPGSTTRNYQMALLEHDGGPEQITREELRRYLAERSANNALSLRYDIQPALPRTVGGEVKAAELDQCQLNEVVLTGTALLPAVKPDDPEIATTYERLKSKQFIRLERLSVAIALADRDKLGAAITPTEDELKAWFAAHKAQFPGDPDPKDPKKEPTPKTLEQVKDQVIAKIRNERGSAAAQKLIDDFNANAEELESKKDATEYRNAVSKAKLDLVVQHIEDRKPGTLDLGKLGTIKDVGHLFGHEHDIGILTQPIETSLGHWVVLRIESRHEAGFQTLEEVKPKVISYLAGRRAWKNLVDQANKIRDSLKGPGALTAWAATSEGKAWNATATTKDVSLLQELHQAAKEPDSTSTDTFLVASLAMPGRPVQLAATDSSWDGDIPRMRLVQVGEIKPGTMDIANERLISAYRDALERFSGSLFNHDINAKIGIR